MSEKSLVVCLYGEPVGTLIQTPTGKMSFQYADSARYTLSMGMPVREAAYDEIQTEAYFGGLLPESVAARKAIAQRYGVNHHNNFSLLKAIGYDCAGAVSLHGDDNPIDAKTEFQLTGQKLSDAELHQHIQDLPTKPLFLGVEGLRLSLAGAQDKAAVCLIDNEIALPLEGCPTTHILKPTIPRFGGMVQNEYVCMRLASRLGMTVPQVEIRQANGEPYLLIERYDRQIENLTVRRVHQEDFCQALGILSSDKYQSEGGPDFKACFELLRNTTQPVKDRNALANLMVFNYLIGNMDAHGKNFSLLLQDEKTIRLTPVYDVSCTRAYPELTQKMAMKIGDHYKPDDIFPRHWERQCKAMGYGYPAMRDLIFTQARLLPEVMREEQDLLKSKNLYHLVLDEMAVFFEQNIERLLKRFEEAA